jgi:hypothetical protein
VSVKFRFVFTWGVKDNFKYLEIQGSVVVLFSIKLIVSLRQGVKVSLGRTPDGHRDGHTRLQRSQIRRRNPNRLSHV